MEFLPKRVEKPWGYEIIWALTDKYCGKILHIIPNGQLSKQYHNIKDETVSVLKGILHLEVNDQHLYLKEGESYHITPKTIHRFCSDGSEVELLEVSTPELDDVVRLEDNYGRKDIPLPPKSIPERYDDLGNSLNGFKT